jgi:hypothetical protein
MVSIGRANAQYGDTIDSLLQRAQHGLSGNQAAEPLRAAAAAAADPSSKNPSSKG